MNISRIIKTVFMLDFLSGLLIAIKEIFKSKKTINYPFEKGNVYTVACAKNPALLMQ